ncbi:uncharacterized, partial [Tachysurus ichikawai]
RVLDDSPIIEAWQKRGSLDTARQRVEKGTPPTYLVPGSGEKNPDPTTGFGNDRTSNANVAEDAVKVLLRTR